MWKYRDRIVCSLVLIALLSLGAFAVQQLFALKAIELHPLKDWKEYGDAAKAVALMAAAVYFLWKTISGYEITN